MAWFSVILKCFRVIIVTDCFKSDGCRLQKSKQIWTPLLTIADGSHLQKSKQT